jgi:hypothetical protein
VSITPAINAPAPSQSTAPATSKPASWLEHHVGEMVAAAAGAIAAALGEFRDGGLTPATKMLWRHHRRALQALRQFLIVDFRDFDGMARTHGAAVLRETCGGDVSLAIVECSTPWPRSSAIS